MPTPVKTVKPADALTPVADPLPMTLAPEAAPAPEPAPAPAPAQAVATVDDFDDLAADAGRGTEGIERKGKLPILTLCQAGNPQRKQGNKKFIQGLQELDLFNSATKEIYGPGPLPFIVLKWLGTRWIYFPDKKKDPPTARIEFDLPESDDRTKWHVVGDRDIKPEATMFWDFLVYVPEKNDVLVLSFKGTQISEGKDLKRTIGESLKLPNGKLVLEPPAWARTFTLATKMKEGDGNAWGVFVVKEIAVTTKDIRLTCSALVTQFEKNAEKMRERLNREAAAEHAERGDDENTIEGTVVPPPAAGDPPPAEDVF